MSANSSAAAPRSAMTGQCHCKLLITNRAASGSATLGYRRSLADAEYVGFLDDEAVLATDDHIGARPFAEQHDVADLDGERLQLARWVALPRPHGEHLAFDRLLLGTIRNEDAAWRSLIGFDPFQQDPVVQRSKSRHPSSPIFMR